MKEFEICFTDFVDQQVCTRTMQADEAAARGLLLFRDKYARDPSRVMDAADEADLLAAFCLTHDVITDHIIERAMADAAYCKKLTDDACDTMSKLQGMDWHELGDSKRAGFDAAREAGTLADCKTEFAAFVQFMLRAGRPVPSLFQDLLTLREN